MRRRKIYYVPGLISLTILFPLLYKALQKERARHDYRIMEVHMFDPARLLEDPLYGQSYSTYPPPRDYLTLELTGDAITDKIKLDYAQLRIREIENTSELLHGVNFHFTTSARYELFVRALDVLKRENATRYLAARKDIWFWATPKPLTAPPKAAYMGCCVCSNRSIIEAGYASQLEDLFYRFKSYWPISILFITLILCTVHFSKLRNRPAVLELMGMFAKMRWWQ